VDDGIDSDKRGSESLRVKDGCFVEFDVDSVKIRDVAGRQIIDYDDAIYGMTAQSGRSKV